MGKIVNRVSEVAGKRRMQIADIAREGKITYDAVKRQWYATATRIDLGTLAGLCDALRCQPGDLFTYVENDRHDGDPN
ncbi:MAG: helix-turn-helix domain-containing protein [Planctomycetota bacterium]